MKPPETKMLRIGQNAAGLWEAHCRPCMTRLSSTYSEDVFDDLDRHVHTAHHAANVLLWQHGYGRAA